jgi:hypothetical protein
MSTTITTVDPHVTLPLPVELMPMKLPPGLPQKLDLVSAVAKHFTPEEKRAASAWLAQHPEVPVADNGPRVFPDPYTEKVHRELKLIAERRRGRTPNGFSEDGTESDPLSDDDYDTLIGSAANSLSLSQDIMARIEAAAASRRKLRRDRSPDRFMSAIDEYVEPYLAIRRGMSLGKAAQTFGIADIQRHLADVEQWLALLELIPRFNRDAFLARLERAVAKRRKDAVYRLRPAIVPVVVVEKLPDRGWDGLNVTITPAAKAQTRKRDKPRTVPLPLSADVSVAKNAKAELVDERRNEMMDAWIGATRPLGPQAARALTTVKIPPTRKQERNHELEVGILAILEDMPYSAHRCELVQVVDLAQAGKSNPEIARAVGISVPTVNRWLAEVKTAAKAEACHDSAIFSGRGSHSESVT